MDDIARLDYCELELPTGVSFHKRPGSSFAPNATTWEVKQDGVTLLLRPTLREAIEETVSKLGIEIMGGMR